jgi:hypothetical protein
MDTREQSVSPGQAPTATRLFPAHVVPNHDFLAIANPIPGSEMLGYGFNIFGTYDFDSATRPLFDLGTPEPYEAANGKTYNRPSRVAVGGGESSASAYSFDSADQFASHFQSSAGISGSYGAFSASFSSAYQSDQQSSSQYSWALVESKVLSWSVTLDASAANVRPHVHSDPDFSSLPSTYSPENAHLFFAFFNKFGTHFISEIDVGGTLYYCHLSPDRTRSATAKSG